jgi:hypothetical protein
MPVACPADGHDRGQASLDLILLPQFALVLGVIQPKFLQRPSFPQKNQRIRIRETVLLAEQNTKSLGALLPFYPN